MPYSDYSDTDDLRSQLLQGGGSSAPRLPQQFFNQHPDMNTSALFGKYMEGDPTLEAQRMKNMAGVYHADQDRMAQMNQQAFQAQQAALGRQQAEKMAQAQFQHAIGLHGLDKGKVDIKQGKSGFELEPWGGTP